MSGGDLTFKLILEADSKSLVANFKQSKEVATSVFESIKQEAIELRQATESTSKEIGQIIPDEAKQDVAQIKNELNAASSAIDAVGTEATSTANQINHLDAELNQTNNALVKTESVSKTVSSEISGLKTGFTALTGALAVLGIGTSSMEIAQTVDEYKNLSGRVNIAIGEHGNLQKAMDDVKNVAIATNSNLTATGDLYSRLTKNGTEMKWPQEQALALTETINKAIQVGGGSAASNEAAITQLNQALGSGVLRGDEFNSMMEQSPRLTQALAEGLGVTTGKLREMAGEGKLTTDVVTKALLTQSEKISSEYAKFPATIGSAIENLKTSWTTYIGEADAASGVSEKVANAISLVANNLDNIVSMLTLAGQAFIAYKALNIANTFFDKAISVKAASTAIAQETTTVVANTQVQIANAAATRSAAVAKTEFAAKSATASAAATSTSGSIMGLIGRLGSLGIAITAVGLLVPTVFEPIGTFIGEGVAKLQGYDQALKELERQESIDAARAKVVVESKKEIAAALQKSREKAYELTEETKKLITQFDELKKKGESVKDILDKISDAMNFDSTQGINNSVNALIYLRDEGKITGDQLKESIGQALNGRDLIVFETNARAAFQGTKHEAEKTAEVTQAVMQAALERTGLSAQQLQGRFSAAFQSAVNDIQIVINNLDDYKAKGIDTGLALSANLNKAVDTSQTRAELDYARSSLLSLEKQGVITGEQVALGLSKIEQKALQLPAALNPIEAAFASLGIKTKEQLSAAADAAQRNFSVVSNSGSATADTIKQAYTAMLNTVVASGNKSQIALAQAKAASLGLEVQIDSSGNASVTSMNNLESSIRGVGNAFDGIKGQARSTGETIRGEAQASSKAWESAAQAMHKTVTGTRAKMAYDAEAIKAKLVEKGYTETRATQMANEIYESSKNGNNGYKQVGNNWSFVGGGGGMSNVEYVDQILAKYKGPQTAVQSTSTRKLEITSGAQTSSLYGSDSDVDSLESILSEFEVIKKSS